MKSMEDVLRELGWSQELIDAFVGPVPVADGVDMLEFDASIDCVDVTEITIDLGDARDATSSNFEFEA